VVGFEAMSDVIATGIRLRSGIRPDAGRPGGLKRVAHPMALALLAATVLAAFAGGAAMVRNESSSARALAAQADANYDLRQRVISLEARINAQPDWPAIVRR